jgi:hypothetical protein
MRRKDMPLVPDHGTPLAARRLAEEAGSVEPWNFWDPPFTYRTDTLPTFLLFLTDGAARELKATQTTADSMTLWLTDGESELYYTALAGELVADKGRGLCRMLENFPRQTPEPARKKLAGHAAQFFFGGSRL